MVTSQGKPVPVAGSSPVTSSMRQVPKEIILQAKLAHEAIHDPKNPTHVKIGVRTLPIFRLRNGCKAVSLGTYTVVQQDTRKDTKYARRARAGEKISWIIPHLPDVSWHLLDATSSGSQ